MLINSYLAFCFLLFSMTTLLQLGVHMHQPSPQAFSARSILDSTVSCDVTEGYMHHFHALLLKVLLSNIKQLSTNQRSRNRSVNTNDFYFIEDGRVRQTPKLKLEIKKLKFMYVFYMSLSHSSCINFQSRLYSLLTLFRVLSFFQILRNLSENERILFLSFKKTSFTHQFHQRPQWCSCMFMAQSLFFFYLS